MALPADPGSLQGWDPSMALVDELHVVTDDTFEAMAARAGKRDRSLLLAISTPPKAGQTTGSCGGWSTTAARAATRRSTSPSSPPRPAARSTTKQAWAVANPALDDFLHRDALRATLPPKMRENAFRRYRLGQWSAVDDAWLPDGAWAGCADATRVDGRPGRRRAGVRRVVLAATARCWWPPPSSPAPMSSWSSCGKRPRAPRLARAGGRRRGRHPRRVSALAGARGGRRPLPLAAVAGSARRRRRPRP